MRIFLTAVLLWSPAMSQADTIRAISTTDDLSNNAVYSIWQDSIHHLWIGTADGLNIWNGHSIEQFLAADGNSYFAGNTIRNIQPADNSHIWLQTDNGIARLNTQTREVSFHQELAFTIDMTIRKDGEACIVGHDLFLYRLTADSTSFTKSRTAILPGTAKDYSCIILSDDPGYGKWGGELLLYR